MKLDNPNVALGQQIALEHGVYGDEWACLYNLWTKESGWNHLAQNKSSGAFGIVQALPASKIDTYGNRYDPAVQIDWGIHYIKNRYSSPCNAWAFSVNNNWY